MRLKFSGLPTENIWCFFPQQKDVGNLGRSPLPADIDAASKRDHPLSNQLVCAFNDLYAPKKFIWNPKRGYLQATFYRFHVYFQGFKGQSPQVTSIDHWRPPDSVDQLFLHILQHQKNRQAIKHWRLATMAFISNWEGLKVLKIANFSLCPGHYSG